jgi:hypothetical protein
MDEWAASLSVGESNEAYDEGNKVCATEVPALRLPLLYSYYHSSSVTIKWREEIIQYTYLTICQNIYSTKEFS